MTFCSIRSIGDIITLTCKPFLFLKLYSFPWWIPQHHIKPAIPSCLFILRLFIPYWHTEHIRERQMPVEELILLGEAANLLLVPTVDDVERIALDLAKEFFGDRVGMIVVSDLLPDESRAP